MLVGDAEAKWGGGVGGGFLGVLGISLIQA